MLVMTHKPGDVIHIGEDGSSITILEAQGSKVKVGYNFPKGTTILRDKVKERTNGSDSVQND